LNAIKSRGYLSNGAGNSITEFNYSTLTPIRTVPAHGKNPDAIVYDAATRRVLTFNGKSNDVSILNASTLEVVGTVVVPGKPEFAQTDGHGRIFANIETEPGQMVRIDIAAGKLDATWQLEGCNSPSGLAFDHVRGHLFSVCDDKVMAVTDAVTGKAVTRVTIGEGPDAAEYDATRGVVLSSNGRDGTMSVIRQDKGGHYVQQQTLKTQRGARTMAMDPESGRVYLVTADFAPVPAGSTGRPTPIPDSFTVLVVAP
jgi:YVTN family beta-propeller protein